MVAPIGENVKRPYRSAVREEQARRTRQAVVTAAAELFVECGYAGTTVEMIADRAGVNRRTVFTSVGGKAGALKLAVDWANVGDDEPVPMLERAHVRAGLADPDARRILRLFAQDFVAIAGRNAALLAVVDVAADADAQVRALADDIDRQRTVGMTAIASVIAKCGALRADLSVERAADVLVSVASPATYRWMVPRRGWAPDEFGRWLGDTLVNLLVAPGWKPSPSGSSVARPTSRRSRSSG